MDQLDCREDYDADHEDRCKETSARARLCDLHIVGLDAGEALETRSTFFISHKKLECLQVGVG